MAIRVVYVYDDNLKKWWTHIGIGGKLKKWVYKRYIDIEVNYICKLKRRNDDCK